MIQQSPAKTERFLKAINKAAMEKCTDISKQIEDTTKLEMQKAEEEARKAGHYKVDSAKAKIQAKAKMTVAKYHLEKRSSIYAKRFEYKKQIFAQAKDKLCEFAKTDDYVEFLKKSASSISDKVGENPIILISKNDEKYEDTIKSYFANTSFEFDATIEIGGLRVKDEQSGIMIDDTLDTRLDEQKNWFLENAQMRVEAE